MRWFPGSGRLGRFEQAAPALWRTGLLPYIATSMNPRTGSTKPKHLIASPATAKHLPYIVKKGTDIGRDDHEQH